MEQTLVPTSEWLDNTTTAMCMQTTGGYVPTVTTGVITITPYCIEPQLYYPYYQYVYRDAPRPIKLTLSEIERLRKAAKADDKLKAILAKFTHQIEITVDFE